MTAQHSKFAPSRMERVLACAGAFALEADMPSRETKYTDEGSIAHTLAQWALTDGGFNARAYLGQVITGVENKGRPEENEFSLEVTEAMCAAVQVYVDAVKKRIDDYNLDKNVKSVTLHVEKKLDISPVIDVEGEFGMADTIIVVEYKDGSHFISVEDLKYGAGVPVVAKDNAQLMTYAAAALIEYGTNAPVGTVGMVIHMPRIGYVSEHTLTAQELHDFSEVLKAGVTRALEQQKLFKKNGVEALELTTGAKHCRFCRASSLCPAFKAAAEKRKQEKNGKAAAKKPPSPGKKE